MNRSRLLAAVFLCGLTLCSGGWAANSDYTAFLAAHREAIAANPPGLTFALKVQAKKLSFHQGEVIDVGLLFSSSKPDVYELDAATYDRSGRLRADVFHVFPADATVDPLRDYFDGRISISGGMRSTPMLKPEAYEVVRTLNEHLRFDVPGTYRVYVVSSRVEDHSQPIVKNSRSYEPTASELIEIEILRRDADWDAAQLADILQGLKIHSGEQRRDAGKRLRHLGSRESVLELVRQYAITPHDNIRWHAKFGLFSHPDREYVVSEMTRMMLSAGYPATDDYVRNLTLLMYKLKHPEPQPPYPAYENETERKKWRVMSDQRQEIKDDIQRSLHKQLEGVLELKQGRAKASTLASLLTMLNSSAGQSMLSADFIAALPRQIPEVFEDLPSGMQGNMLSYHWHLFGGPEMLPVLRRIYGIKVYTHETRHLPGMALRRIYSVAPEEGRHLILEEIRSGQTNGGVHYMSLLILPDEPIPELDETLASGIERNRNRSDQARCASLLERYGSAAILPRIRAAYDNGRRWKSSSNACILAYFLRAAPQFGAGVINNLFDHGVEPGSGHTWPILAKIADCHYSPELENIAISLLDHPQLSVVADAARVLGSHGSAASEAPLSKRLQAWHAKWKDDPDIMRPERSRATDAKREVISAGAALRNAIILGQGWLCDGDAIEKIQALCLYDREREQLGHKLGYWTKGKHRISYSPGRGEWGKLSVAQYKCESLEAALKKIAQFPEDTVFVWSPYLAPLRHNEFAAVRDALAPMIEKNGMTLEDGK